MYDTTEQPVTEQFDPFKQTPQDLIDKAKDMGWDFIVEHGWDIYKSEYPEAAAIVSDLLDKAQKRLKDYWDQHIPEIVIGGISVIVFMPAIQQQVIDDAFGFRIKHIPIPLGTYEYTSDRGLIWDFSPKIIWTFKWGTEDNKSKIELIIDLKF